MRKKQNEKYSTITWEELKKELNNTPEQNAAIQLEIELIEATIKARESANMTQRELAEKSGMKQSAIARIEKNERISICRYIKSFIIPIRI